MSLSTLLSMKQRIQYCIWIAGFAFGCEPEEKIILSQSDVDYPSDNSSSNAQWSLPEVEQQLKEILESPFPVAKPIVDNYLVLMFHGDPICPGDPFALNPDISAGCEATSGFYYQGIAECFFTEDFDFVLENASAETIQLPDMTGWTNESGQFLVGDFEILRPNGHSFSAGGWVMDGRFKRQSEDILFGGITGSWKDPEGTTQWHQEGISALFFYLVEPSITESEEHSLILEGVLGFNGIHLRFGNVQVSEHCDTGFNGLLGIRDPSGRWHELYSEDDCGCAQHSYLGEPSGAEICLDWTGILQGYVQHMESL